MGHSKQDSKEILDKLYFKIGEVSRIVGVDTHVLRYWESEFKMIRPQRTPSRQRLYRRDDIDNLLKVRELLHERGFTIAGARQALKEEKNTGRSGGGSPEKLVSALKKELLDLKKLLHG
ncbi:MAG: MerR family transcriptional regulator [Desulfurivibrionaceae bacterium]|nr:MerR family transcriptional regulator [Desulfurivibrionaceae bacterium]